MAISVARKGQIFLKKEAAFGTEEPLVATNAMRHLDYSAAFDPFNRVKSMEKKQSPGTVVLFDRKKTANWDLRSALLRPSGTLNTLPECDPVLECGFGSKTNVTLATTVAVGGVGSTTADTLTSAAGLAIGDALLFIVAGLKYVRNLVTVNTGTGVITWAPALPGSLVDGSAVKACPTYKLSTNLAISLTILHAVGAFQREVLGAGVDKLSIIFDGNEEPKLSASGPAAAWKASGIQSTPGSFTTVGGNPPSGLVGETLIGDVSYLMLRANVDIMNGLKLRMDEYGVNPASELFRGGRREIAVSLDAFLETQATLYDFTVAGTQKSFFNQTGRTEGNIVAIYLPKVDWKVPAQDDGDGEIKWSFKGTAMESADSANDEAYLSIA